MTPYQPNRDQQPTFIVMKVFPYIRERKVFLRCHLVGWWMDEKFWTSQVVRNQNLCSPVTKTEVPEAETSSHGNSKLSTGDKDVPWIG